MIESFKPYELLSACGNPYVPHKPNVLFVEGYDKVGKTYLIEGLKENLSDDSNILFYDNSWNDSCSPLNDLSKVDQGFIIGLSILDFIRSQTEIFSGKIIIIDRSILSSVAYAVLFSESNDFIQKLVDISGKISYYNKFINISHIIVYHKNNNDLIERYNSSKGREELVDESLSEYKSSYTSYNKLMEELFTLTKSSHISYYNEMI